MVDGALELIAPALARIGNNGSLQLIEAIFGQYATLIRSQGGQVPIEELKPANALRRAHQPQRNPGDDAALPEPTAHDIEQIRIRTW